MAGAKGLYLAAYNGVQALGWGYVLVQLALFVAGRGVGPAMLSTPPTGFWEFQRLGEVLLIFQNLAALEVVHSVAGLVRSPFFTTAVQVASRLLLVNVCGVFPSVRTQWGVVLMVGAWSITEVVRYTFFALKELNISIPYFLIWLRYSMFFVLYPAGVAGELLTFWASKPEIENLDDELIPGPVNPIHIFYLIIVAYLPGLPLMYTHMISQRRKVLRGAEATVARAKKDA